jgi:hypothetical protein
MADTTVVTPRLEVIPEDWLAVLDINNAADLSSQDPADRTTTITVTADDGVNQNTYTVLFRYASADASLSELSVSKGMLKPDFHRDSLLYKVCLPKGEKVTPEVTCLTTDPYATTVVVPAANINRWLVDRTTVITVTAEDGIHKKIYTIEFNVDKTIPSLDLYGVPGAPTDSIEVSSMEDGYICLVPVNTFAHPDTALAHMLDSVAVMAGAHAFLRLPEEKEYWIYAIDQCLNISTPRSTLSTGIHQITAASLRLYPVPVDRTLYIETVETLSSVELYNLIGVKIMEVSNPEGSLDMGHLGQGMYFILIRTNRGLVYTGKVMKK